MQRDDRPRSLERKSMDTIFAPLDANEPLPRELLKESRHLGFFAIPLDRTVGRRELAGALWLPALCLVLVLAAWGKMGAVISFGVIVLLFVTFLVFAFSSERKSPLK